jgi:aromatic-L-amino-acid decarboxylase
MMSNSNIQTGPSDHDAAGSVELPSEETLDPADWEALRSLGYRMVDDMFDCLRDIRTSPAWRPVPEEVKHYFRAAVPRTATPVDRLYDEFKRYVLPYPTGNIHPRFWGWVMGTGSPLAMLADMLASGMNPHVAGYDQSAYYLEKQVIAWLAELLGLPAESGGLLVGGGSMANLIGLAVARHTHAGFDIRARGLQSGDKKLIFYCSVETHSWAQKAVELMGIGSDNLRRIAVTDEFQMSLPDLKRAIKDDRNAGLSPICVIATAGTVNTGATDDLRALRELCTQESLWLHVDGAFGAFAALSQKYRYLVNGLELVDSLAIDLHKWMYMPFEAGCVFIRDRALQKETFSVAPNYLNTFSRGISSQPMDFSALGLDLSRGFKALKVWMSIQAEGADKFGRLVEQNIEQAMHLQRLILAEPKLELMTPVALNVVCFRFLFAGAQSTELNRLNAELLMRVQESGIAVPSSTLLNGRFAIRVAITNHRSRLDDFNLLIRTVSNFGAAIEAEK